MSLEMVEEVTWRGQLQVGMGGPQDGRRFMGPMEMEVQRGPNLPGPCLWLRTFAFTLSPHSHAGAGGLLWGLVCCLRAI